MQLLQYTHPTAAGNLAIDEALLDYAEANEDHPELLRLWEPNQTMVVLGRSSPVEIETNRSYCEANQIEIIRRCSGGQTIVTGPGCLMYAVLLDYRRRPELRMLDRAHEFVIGKMKTAIQTLGIPVRMKGTSDLTFQGRKFSGNALRCKRNWLIYHGTLLCDFDLNLIAKCLGKPIREPDYREGRSHLEFLTQLPTTTEKLREAIASEWSSGPRAESWPRELTTNLMQLKYQQDEWNFKI